MKSTSSKISRDVKANSLELAVSRFAPKRSMKLTSNQPRNGFTLMEVLLVFAIMVVLAALAIPSIQRTFAQQALTKGADRLRVAMGQARVRAIRNGEEYAVFISPGGAFFSVAPLSKFQEQAAEAGRRQQLSDQRRQSNFEEDLLPQGVFFVADEVGTSSRSMFAMAASSAGGASVKPILFYPDGTSQDAKVVLQNEKQNQIEVQLRGLTGMAKTVRINQSRGQ